MIEMKVGIVKEEDVILVKASNGMHFMEIVNSLRG